MGGYGGYVWAAFGFTLVLMIGLLWQSWRLQQRRTDELAELRRTLRGDSGRGDAERPVRRLVATKPGAEPGQAAGTIDPAAIAASRPTSGS
jgi:heme exporter protein CcmD